MGGPWVDALASILCLVRSQGLDMLCCAAASCNLVGVLRTADRVLLGDWAPLVRVCKPCNEQGVLQERESSFLCTPCNEGVHPCICCGCLDGLSHCCVNFSMHDM